MSEKGHPSTTFTRQFLFQLRSWSFSSDLTFNIFATETPTKPDFPRCLKETKSARPAEKKAWVARQKVRSSPLLPVTSSWANGNGLLVRDNDSYRIKDICSVARLRQSRRHDMFMNYLPFSSSATSLDQHDMVQMFENKKTSCQLFVITLKIHEGRIVTR